MKLQPIEISLEEQYCLTDIVELPMYLERLNGAMPWVIHRKMRYVWAQLPRKPYLSGMVSSTAAKELLQRGFIEQRSGETFVVSEAGEEYYEQHLKPKA